MWRSASLVIPRYHSVNIKYITHLSSVKKEAILARGGQSHQGVRPWGQASSGALEGEQTFGETLFEGDEGSGAGGHGGRS